MRNKANIGEFKLIGFIGFFVAAFVLAISLYSRLTFVTNPPQQTQTERQEIKRLQDEIDDLKKQLSSLGEKATQLPGTPVHRKLKAHDR